MAQKVKIFLQNIGMGVLWVYSCDNWDTFYFNRETLTTLGDKNKEKPAYSQIHSIQEGIWWLKILFLSLVSKRFI